MRVEIVANRLAETDPETGLLCSAFKGDVLTVTDAFGQHLCNRGWAKDTEGKYSSAPFAPGAARVSPDPLTTKGG